MKKKLAVAAATVFSALLLAGCSSETVATSKAGDITKADLYDAMKESAGETTFQQLALEQALNKEVGKNDLKNEAKEEVTQAVNSYGGEEQFNYVLSQSGYTDRAAYEQAIYLQKLVQSAVKKNTKFTEKELRKYYETYQPDITASHILVSAEDEAKAKEIIQQLNDGEDFAKLAKENSTDTATAEKGGDLGSFGKGDMDETFYNAAIKLKVGEVTPEPVKTQYGYHIIKLTKKPEKKSFDDERENIQAQMLQEKLQDSNYVNNTVAKIVQDADFDIKDDDLKSALDQFKPSSESSSSSSSEESSSESQSSSSESGSAE